MNPLTNTRNLKKLSEQQLDRPSKTSFHDQHKHSPWIFVGGLSSDLSEGDLIAVFSQYGEIIEVNLIRDRETGKSKGYAFIKYEKQKSTILAVDNFNGITLRHRIIRVDHSKDEKDREMDREEREELRAKHRRR